MISRDGEAPAGGDGRSFREMQRRGRLPLQMRRCGVRVAWTYYEYPLGGYEIYVDRIRVTTLVGSYDLALTSIREVTLEREILLKWIQIKHSDAAVPELAIWTFRLDSVAAHLRSLITPA